MEKLRGDSEVSERIKELASAMAKMRHFSSKWFVEGGYRWKVQPEQYHWENHEHISGVRDGYLL